MASDPEHGYERYSIGYIDPMPHTRIEPPAPEPPDYRGLALWVVWGISVIFLVATVELYVMHLARCGHLICS